MSLDEAARIIIRKFLENDINQFKKWLGQIDKFNAEQIEELLKGNINYQYPVKNQENFKLLIYKFENYQNLISEWYTKENYHQYLIELWKNYISIEELKCINNDAELSDYLES